MFTEFNERQERQHPERKEGDRRICFQRDLDRILYSSAFRRLAQVTQVVSVSEGHVFHNRLTHSLKVAQIGKRLAERLVREQNELAQNFGGIDPNVVEAAGLVHDLGHPPFGHIAEEELDSLARARGLNDGFEGNAQTFRILTRLATHRRDYYGLNLTRATLNAVLKYPWFRNIEGEATRAKNWRKYSVYKLDKIAFDFVRDATREEKGERKTVEAAIMEFADDLTYSIHDLEDFYFAGLIPLNVLETDPIEFETFIEEWQVTLRRQGSEDEAEKVEKNKDNLKQFLQVTYNSDSYRPGSVDQLSHIQRVSSFLIQDCLNSVELAEKYSEKNGYFKLKEEYKDDERYNNLSLYLKFLQRIVWRYVILNPRLATQQHGQRKIIRTLFENYYEAVEKENLNLIPARFVKERGLHLDEGQDLEFQRKRMVVDIVAGFSEPEALMMYRRLTGTDLGSVTDYLV